MVSKTVPFTVAIPTMRRFKGFLEKSIPIYLDNPSITAIVVCDETGEDITQIEQQSWGKHPKLRLHRNPKRLGMYYNKRKCLEVSPTDWVGVLDSDNIFPEAFFETLMESWREDGADPKQIYASGQILRVFQKTGESEEKTRHFEGMKITKENWNKILETKAWNFLLNDGNWVGHKSLLQAWPTDIREEDIRATDSIRIVRNFILQGFTYYLVPGLRYIHTVHDDSEWIKTEAESSYLLATTNWKITV
jgi:glycosyltransferase involved in cell wall biosynthesis